VRFEVWVPREVVYSLSDNDARAQPDPSSRQADSRQANPDLLLQIANTDGQGARLREEPSRTACSLQIVPDGAPVEAFGPEQDGEGLRWRPVRTSDGAESWIAASLLAPPESMDAAS
jgi:hypothetical protein